MRRPFLFLVALALFAGACGGGDDAADSTTTDASSDTSDSDSSSDGDSENGDDAASDGDGDDAADIDLPEEGSGSSTDFCETIVALNAETDAFDPFGGADAIREFYEETAALSSQLAANAPSEVADDAKTLNESFQELIVVLDEYDYNFLAIPEEVLDAPPFENPDAEASDARISAFCGLENSDLDDFDTGDFDTDDFEVPEVSIPDELTDVIVQQFLDEGFDEATAQCLAETVGDFTNNSEFFTPENLTDPEFEVCGLSFQEAFG